MRETTIIRQLRAGDPAGLEALMDAYLPYVSAVVWHILGRAMPPEDGEEVVSDVFLAAWDQAEDLRPGQIKVWLAAVARHKARNRLRQTGRALPLEGEALEIPGQADPADQLARAEEGQLVRAAVDALPNQEREIFLRYYYYAQTMPEIAQRMDLNLSTVKTKLRRGRMKLKEQLTREGYVHEA